MASDGSPIDNLKKDLELLQKDFINFKKRNASEIGGITEKEDEMQKEFNKIKTKVSDIMNEAKTIEDAGELIKKLKDSNSKLFKQNKVINEILQDYEKNFKPNYENDQKNNNSDHETYESDIKSIKEFNDKENERLEALHNKIKSETQASIESAISELKKDLMTQIKKVDKKAKKMHESNNEAITEQTKRVDQLFTTTEEHTQQITKLDKAVDDINKTISDHRNELDDIKSNIDKHNTRISSLEEFQEQTTNTLTEINTALDDLRNKIAALKEDNEKDTEEWKSTIAKVQTEEREHTDKLYEKNRNAIKANTEDIEQLKKDLADFKGSTGVKFSDTQKAIDELKKFAESVEANTNKAIEAFQAENADMRKTVEAGNKRNNEIATKMAFIQGDQNISMTDLSKTIEQVRKTVNQTVENSKSIVEKIRKETKESVDNVMASTNDKVNSVQSQFDGLTKSTNKSVADTKASLEQRIQKEVEKINAEMTATTQRLSDVIGKSSLTLEQVAKKFEEDEKTCSQRNQATEAELQKLDKQIKSLATKEENDLSLITNNIELFKDDTNKQRENFEAKVAERLSTHKTKIENIKKSVEEAKEDFNSKIESANVSIAAQKQELMDEIAKLKQETDDHFVKSDEAISASKTEVTRETDEKLSKMKDTFTRLKELLKSLQSSSGVTLDDLLKEIENLKDSLAKQIDSTQKLADQKVNECKVQFAALEKTTDEHIANIVAKLQDQAQKSTEEVHAASDRAKADLQKAKDSLTEKIQSVEQKHDKFVGGIASTAPDIVERINQIEKSSSDRISHIEKRQTRKSDEFNEYKGKMDVELKSIRDTIDVNQKDLQQQINVGNNNIEDLKNEVKTNNANSESGLTALEEKVEKRISDQIDAQAQQSDMRQKEIDQLGSDIKALEEKMKESVETSRVRTETHVSGKLKKLKTKLETVDGRLTALTGSDDVSIPAIAKRITDLENQAVQDRESSDKKLADKSSELADMVKSAAKTAAKNLNEAKEELSAEINKVNSVSENGLKDLQDKVSTVSQTSKEAQNSLQQQITDLKQGSPATIKDLQTRIEEVNNQAESALHNHDSLIASLTQKTDKSRKDIEEQVTNSIRKELASMKAKTKELETDTQSIKETMQALPSKKDIHNINKKFAELQGETKETIPSLLEKVNGTITEIEQCEVRCNKAAQDMLKKHENDTAELTQAVQNVIKDSTLTLADAGREIAELNKQVSSLKKRTGEFQSSATETLSKLTKDVKETKTNTDTSIGEMKAQISTVDSTLQESIKTLKTDINTKVAGIENTVNEDFKQTNSTIELLSQKVDKNIESMNVTHQQKSDKLNQSIEDLQKKSSKLEQKIIKTRSYIEQYVTDQNAKEENNKQDHENSLKQQHDEIAKEIKMAIDEQAKQLTERNNEENMKLTQDITDVRNTIVALKGKTDDDVTLAQTFKKVISLKKLIESQAQDSEQSLISLKQELQLLIEQSQKETNTKFAAVDKQFEQDEANTQNIVTDFKDTMGKYKKEILSEIRKSGAENVQKIAEIEKKHEDSIKLTNDKVESQIKELEGLVTANEAEVSKLSMQVQSANEKQSSELDTFMSKASKKVKEQINSSLADQNKHFAAQLEALEQERQKSQESVQAVRKELSDVKKRIDQQIEQQSQEIAQSAKEMNDKNSQFVQKVQNDIEQISKTVSDDAKQVIEFKRQMKENKANTESKIEQLSNELNTASDLTKAQIQDFDKRLTSITTQQEKKMDDFIELTNSSIADKTKSLNDQITQKSVEFENSIKSLQEKVIHDVSETQNKQRGLISAVEAEVKSLSETVYKKHAKKLSAIEKDLQSQRNDIESVKKDSTAKIINIEKTTLQATSELSAEAAKTQKLVSRMDESVSSLSTGFDAVKLDFSVLQRKFDSEMGVIKKSVDTATNEIAALQHIHKLNADFESFNMRFEQTLVNIQQFHRTICNFVFPEFQALAAENAKPERVKVPMSSNAKPTRIPKSGQFVLQNIEPDAELGALLRRAFLEHQNVYVKLPTRAKLTWNKPLKLEPHQTLFIESEDKSTIITMDGQAQLGGLDVPTRAMVDAFATIKFDGVRIQAKTGTAQSAQIQDLTALFVLRSYDAAGPSSVQFLNCDVDTDVDVCNAGGSAAAYIRFVDTRLSNVSKVRNKVLHPVTAVNGGYEQGYAYVSNTNTKLSDRKIAWVEDSQFIETE